jgi:hypothetical protein
MQTAIQTAIPLVDLKFRVEKISTQKRVIEHKTDQKLRKIEHYCDMCGRLTLENQLKRTTNDLQLCTGCHLQFLSIPEGKIRDAAERFMLANVY